MRTRAASLRTRDPARPRTRHPAPAIPTTHHDGGGSEPLQRRPGGPTATCVDGYVSAGAREREREGGTRRRRSHPPHFYQAAYSATSPPLAAPASRREGGAARLRSLPAQLRAVRSSARDFAHLSASGQGMSSFFFSGQELGASRRHGTPCRAALHQHVHRRAQRAWTQFEGSQSLS